MLCSTSPFIIPYNFTIDTRCDPGPAPESPNLLDAFLEDALTFDHLRESQVGYKFSSKYNTKLVATSQLGQCSNIHRTTCG